MSRKTEATRRVLREMLQAVGPVPDGWEERMGYVLAKATIADLDEVRRLFMSLEEWDEVRNLRPGQFFRHNNALWRTDGNYIVWRIAEAGDSGWSWYAKQAADVLDPALKVKLVTVIG